MGPNQENLLTQKITVDSLYPGPLNDSGKIEVKI